MTDRDELVRQARDELDHLVSEAGTEAVRCDKAQYDILIRDYVALNARVKDDPERNDLRGRSPHRGVSRCAARQDAVADRKAAPVTRRERTERLQTHVECALTKLLMPGDFSEIARQLRIMVDDDVTDDEIIMAAHRVRADYRQRSDPYARHNLDLVEANCATWRSR
jgi:hypothetical protein